jgi:nucleotide-binding universal stress UspA family protein
MSVILVATDGSEGGTAALKEAVKMALHSGAELVVLTVTPSIRRRSTPSSQELMEYSRAEHLAGGEAEAMGLVADDILAEAKAIVEDQGHPKASYTSRVGDPASEILACARECSPETLVLGSRGRGPLGAFLLGSVSRKVADAATCPVSIVPKHE